MMLSQLNFGLLRLGIWKISYSVSQTTYTHYPYLHFSLRHPRVSVIVMSARRINIEHVIRLQMFQWEEVDKWTFFTKWAVSINDYFCCKQYSILNSTISSVGPFLATKWTISSKVQHPTLMSNEAIFNSFGICRSSNVVQKLLLSFQYQYQILRPAAPASEQNLPLKHCHRARYS